MDEPARLVNGRTMVPLRFISESLGAQVNWYAPSRTVAITTAAEIANEIAAVSIDGYTQAAGGVQVQMPEGEAAAARQLIEGSQQSPA